VVTDAYDAPVVDLAASPFLPQPAATVAQATAFALVPAATAFAVTRHRLYDLDLALCRAVAVGSDRPRGRRFLHAAGVLSAVLPSTTGAVLAAGVSGLLVQPLATRLRTATERLFYFASLPGRDAFPQLTEREREVLDQVARGHDNRRIARALFLSEKTMRNHVSNVVAKLGVDDRAEAIARARNAGLGG